MKEVVTTIDPEEEFPVTRRANLRIWRNLKSAHQENLKRRF